MNTYGAKLVPSGFKYTVSYELVSADQCPRGRRYCLARMGEEGEPCGETGDWAVRVVHTTTSNDGKEYSTRAWVSQCNQHWSKKYDKLFALEIPTK